MSKLVILQTCAPDYRARVYDTIEKSLGKEYSILAGKEYFESTVKTDYNSERFFSIHNHFLFRRKVLIQSGMWSKVITARVVVMEMNPRILTNWLILSLRRIIGKKTVVWGHAWPRSGKASKSDKLRHFMRLMANGIIVYTKSQKKELQDLMPNKLIWNASNAVMFKDEMMPTSKSDIERTNFIYVGRVTLAKKVKFLVRAFIKYHSILDPQSKLIIVGDGDELIELKSMVIEANLKERIIFYGHVSCLDTLRKLYATSICSISPGYVGLSITQSLGMGVPILISKDENHSPEIEALVEGVNGAFFETDSEKSIIDGLKSFAENNNYWISKSNDMIRSCQQNYSVESMASIFINLVNQ